jgi:membrane-associated phospholipid phosphatase
MLISAKVRSRGAAIALWAVAIALPLIVAASRMYRGMHHPIDATAGALMGLAALAIALFATRAAGTAAAARREEGSS